MKAAKSFLILMITLSLVFSSSLMAFAVNESEIISDEQAQWLRENITGTNSNNGEVTGSESWIKKYITADESKAEMYDGTPVSLGTWSRGDLSGEYYLAKGKTLEGLSKQITKSMNEIGVTNRVSDMIENLELNADTGSATALFKGFEPILNLILGILVTLITVGMTFCSAIDIAYIAFPVFRNRCEDAKMNGGIGTRKTANGETKLAWVTDDAQYATKLGTIESGQSPWAIYFKRRIMSYIMLAITLFILMTGNITLITNIAINIVSGIMDVLGALAA